MFESQAALGDDAPAVFGGIAEGCRAPRDRRTGPDIDHEVALVIQERFAGSNARDFLLGGPYAASRISAQEATVPPRPDALPRFAIITGAPRWKEPLRRSGRRCRVVAAGDQINDA